MKINTLLSVDGKHTKLPPGELSLAQMYKAIGCTTVERVALPDGQEIWCDEEGLLKDLVVNLDATYLYQKFYGKDVCVVGNAILTTQLP